MITFVTAEVNSGKTTWMRQDFETQTNADGFLSVKTFKNGFHCGYNLLHLGSGEMRSFIRKPGYLEKNWDEVFRIRDVYSFNRTGFDFAKHIAQRALDNKIELFYFDEVGPLELQGKGFNPLFKTMLGSGINMKVVVRKTLLEKVCESFKIKDFKIIEL
ncbi:MAG: nucleoside-triphosphatase [Candidatus Rifleibacteriota bacterium]